MDDLERLIDELRQEAGIQEQMAFQEPSSGHQHIGRLMRRALTWLDFIAAVGTLYQSKPKIPPDPPATVRPQGAATEHVMAPPLPPSLFRTD